VFKPQIASIIETVFVVLEGETPAQKYGREDARSSGVEDLDELLDSATDVVVISMA
jgi:hypothetical protein